MTKRNTTPTHFSPGEALGLKLLQSLREMKANQAARVTRIETNEESNDETQNIRTNTSR